MEQNLTFREKASRDFQMSSEWRDISIYGHSTPLFTSSLSFISNICWIDINPNFILHTGDKLNEKEGGGSHEHANGSVPSIPRRFVRSLDTLF